MQDSVLMELEGEESDEPDWDADEGSLLVFPTRIVRVVDIDRRRVDDLKGRAASPARSIARPRYSSARVVSCTRPYVFRTARFRSVWSALSLAPRMSRI